MPESGDTVITDNRRKHLTIVKNMYSGDTILQSMAIKACDKMEDKERVAFATFQVDVGNIFVELKEELDEAVEGLSEDFSDGDPRKWSMDDWLTFEVAVTGHKYEEIIRLYANGQPNIHLIWQELENRLSLS